MAECSVCGNDYEGAFTLIPANGERHIFDSFECAIHAVAPRCGHCGCAVIGHGVHAESVTYCCSHCARSATGAALADRP